MAIGKKLTTINCGPYSVTWFIVTASLLISISNTGTSVVSRQVFGGAGQIETWFEKPRRVKTGFETTQYLIHSSK